MNHVGVVESCIIMKTGSVVVVVGGVEAHPVFVMHIQHFCSLLQ